MVLTVSFSVHTAAFIYGYVGLMYIYVIRPSNIIIRVHVSTDSTVFMD